MSTEDLENTADDRIEGDTSPGEDFPAEGEDSESDSASLAIQRFEEPIDPSSLDLREEMVQLNRVAKVVKGGRRFSFSSLMIVGDGNGHVGIGFGKAREVPDAIQKAVESAKKTMIRVPLVSRTIPFEVMGQFGAGRVMLKPASEGTGIIAGPAARAVLELAGVNDVLTKVLGSDNTMNVVRATFEGLRSLELAETVALRRGKTVEELMGVKAANRYRDGRETALSGFAEARVQEQDRRDKSHMGTYSAGGRKNSED